MLVNAVVGERTRQLLLPLAAGFTESATLGLFGSSLPAEISAGFGEVKGWVRLAGSCMFVKSKAPEGGERLLSLLLFSPAAELPPSISFLSASLSFDSILRPIFSLRTSFMLLLWLIVVLWKCWIRRHKLTAGPPSAVLPRFWKTTHTHTIQSSVIGIRSNDGIYCLGTLVPVQ